MTPHPANNRVCATFGAGSGPSVTHHAVLDLGGDRGNINGGRDFDRLNGLLGGSSSLRFGVCFPWSSSFSHVHLVFDPGTRILFMDLPPVA